MRVLGKLNSGPDRAKCVRFAMHGRFCGMHAAHVGVCTGARVCGGQGKRLGSHGAAHLNLMGRKDVNVQ